MKKVYIFAGFVLALFVFACTIPTSIEIKGTPRIKFAAKFDFTDMFSGMIGGAFDSGDGENEENGFKMLDCVDVLDYRTFLIRMEIINEEFTFAFDDDVPIPPHINTGKGPDIPVSSIPGLPNHFSLDEDAYLAKDNDLGNDPIKIDFSSLGNYLEGFSFDPEKVKAKLYISGSDIIRSINFDLTLGNEETNISEIELGTSGTAALTSGEYTGTSLPAGGKNISIASLLNRKEEIEVKYEVYIPANEPIQIEWLEAEVNVVAELLVWIPLDLVATGNDGAELAFPGDFMSGVGEFVNSITEVMDSLSLVIEMNVNPFAEGTLVVKSGDIRIENPLSSTALDFEISEDDMKAILAADSFEPEFSIVFEKNEHLRIPRELKITTISLEAKLHYNIDFNEKEEGEEE